MTRVRASGGGAPGPGDAFDQAPVDQATGQCPEGLVGLEGQLGQVVKGGVRVLVQVAQGVPLDDGDPQLGQGLVGSSVVAHLKALDGVPDLLEGYWHELFPTLTKYQPA